MASSGFVAYHSSVFVLSFSAAACCTPANDGYNDNYVVISISMGEVTHRHHVPCEFTVAQYDITCSSKTEEKILIKLSMQDSAQVRGRQDRHPGRRKTHTGMLTHTTVIKTSR